MRNTNARKPFALLLAGLALALFSGALFGQVLQIHYINVQQGQSTLIIGPNGTTILFDGGYENKGTTEVVPYLQSIGIPVTQTLNYIIASHRDTDHFAGLTEVITYGYDAYHVHDNGSDKTNVYVEAFLAAAAGTTAGAVTPLVPGTVIDLGFGATATCVAANGTVLGSGAVSGATANENDRAICLLVKYNGFDFLLNGDMGGGDDDIACTGRSTSQVNMESPTVYAIMPAGVTPFLSEYGVEVAHVGHHGSESSTNPDYMNILTPRVGCISVGAGQDASYMHPRVDVVEHVLLAGVPCITAPPALVLQTEEGAPVGANTSLAGNSVGDIVITTDGINSYTVGADGAVSQGPDERAAAGLPATFYFEEYTAADNAPILYNIRSENVTAASADVAWCSNETATSVVRYGTASGIYANTASDASLVLNHLLALGGLAPATTYYYVVDSTDATGHTTTSGEFTFLTTGAAVSRVVFSEVYYDPAGTETQEEWIELYNNSAAAADIGNWTITDNNASGTSFTVFTIPAGTTMAANSYLTIATNAAGFLALYGYNADIADTASNSLGALNNSGETLILKNNTGVTQDVVHMEGGYGGVAVAQGWGSDTEPNATGGSTIVRTPVTTDTDTFADWTIAGGGGNPQVQPVVTASITVTAPNGGESWAVGSTHDITWTTTGTVGNVDLHYSLNNGTDWTLIAGGEANDGTYSWTVPSVTPSANCLVRVQEADGTPTDASNAVFSITAPAPPAGVVISEVYYDTVGTDAIEEWVELYNNTAAAVNVGGWTITDNYPAGGHVTLPAGLTIAPHTYLTVAADSGGFNALYGYDADYYYGTAIALANGGDALLLRDGSNNLVDAVSFEGGLSGGLPAGWGSTTLPQASRGNTIYRSDVTVDTDTYADWTNTTDGSDGNPQTQLKVVISEVYYDTAGTDAIEEWVELYNNSGRIVDIGGCTITDNYPAGGHITIPAGTRMVPYSFLTVAANSGGFTNLYHYEADYYYGTAIALANGGDALLLRDGLGNLVDAVSFEGGLSGGLPAGWGSATLPQASRGNSIYRSDVTVDTDTYADWTNTTDGGDGDPRTQRRYTLIVVAGAGGTTSPAAGTYTYDEGETVAISATAEAGYSFGGWSGDASGTASPVSVLMNGNKTVTASFLRQCTLTIAAGAGGTTSPVPGTYTYDEGAVVSIGATASAGYRFLNWSGDASGTDNPLSVTVNGDMTVTANFIRQHTLTIAAGAGGTTSPLPGTYTYDEGAVVSIGATASAGYRFLNWSGGASGTDNPLSVTVNGDMTVTANFLRQYSLTIAAGAGGTTSPLPGTYSYDEGAVVVVQAVAAAGSRFASWSGDATGTINPVSVTMDGNKAVTANFIRQYTLTIAAGAGGTTSPLPGTYSYDEGAVVVVQAVAAAGSRFAGWSGDATGTVNPVSVTMNGNRTVTANFVRQYTLTIAAGAGGTTSPLPGTYTYDEGAVVAIGATASAGYRFLNWSGDATGTVNPVSVTMNGNMTVAANFIRQYTLTIIAGAGGTTSPLPGTYTYDEGAVVAVQAAAAAGYRFAGWSGDATGTVNPVSVTMNGNRTVAASFIRQYTLTIIAGAGGTTDPRPGTYQYDEGASVRIAAVAAAGYRFAGWSGFASGMANPISVTMGANRTVIANFVRGMELTITAGAGGTTNPAPGTHYYDIGSRVSIQAIPAPGYEFIAWSGHASGSANPLAIVMNGSKRIHASFARVVKSPLGLVGEKLENRSVSMAEHIVRLRWQANPANAGAVSYRVYRIENGQALAIAEVGAGTTEHVVHGVEESQGYLFGVTAVNGQGWESDMAQVAIR